MNLSFLNVIVFVFLLVAILVLQFYIEPVKRGFFCSDASIRLPYYQNASFGWLAVWAISFGLAMLLFTAENAFNKSKVCFSSSVLQF